MSQAPAPAPAPAPRAPQGGSQPARSPQGPRPDSRGPRRPRGPRGGQGRSAQGGGDRPGRVSRQIRRTLRRPSGPSREQTVAKNTHDYFPAKPAENVVRVVPLGG